MEDLIARIEALEKRVAELEIQTRPPTKRELLDSCMNVITETLENWGDQSTED